MYRRLHKPSLWDLVILLFCSSSLAWWLLEECKIGSGREISKMILVNGTKYDTSRPSTCCPDFSSLNNESSQNRDLKSILLSISLPFCNLPKMIRLLRTCKGPHRWNNSCWFSMQTTILTISIQLTPKYLVVLFLSLPKKEISGSLRDMLPILVVPVVFSILPDLHTTTLFTFPWWHFVPRTINLTHVSTQPTDSQKSNHKSSSGDLAPNSPHWHFCWASAGVLAIVKYP